MNTRISTIIVLLTLAALPLAAQPFDDSRCGLDGTWYGGSAAETPYLLTVEWSRAGHYDVSFQWVASTSEALAWGYDRWTSWSGEATKTGPGQYEVTVISYWMLNHEWAVANGVDDSKPELDMAHATFTFVDCNTMTGTVDMFAGFYAFDPAVHTPFVGPYSWEMPAGDTIVETYQRMVPAAEARSLVPRLKPLNVPSAARTWRHR